jgi:hypothetical protein
MKQGRTLKELAQEIERQSEVKRDFISPSSSLEMNRKMHTPGKPSPAFSFEVRGKGNFEVNDLFHEQLGSRLSIPKPYYEKMACEAPDLLVDNVNHWLKSTDDQRMVRTLDNRARAFLSSRYRPLDNYDLMSTVLPVLFDHKCNIESCEVTERRLYLKVTIPGMEAEVKVGDVVKSGLVISNSEVGSGSVKVEPMIYRLICLNGMIGDTALRKYHLGRKGTSEENIYEILQDDTKTQNDKAFWMQVRDVVKSAFNEAVFNSYVDKLKEATGKVLEKKPDEIAEVVYKRFGLNDEQKSSIMTYLIKGGDMTQWGLINAVTSTANDQDSYEEATRLERLGGDILELPKSDWKSIAAN